MNETAGAAEPYGCGVSVIIKAFNEEEHIASCVCSALEALRTVGGEVILADSGSTDGTVQIAFQFPITITQLADPSQRCCGIGPQLGFQEAKGDFLYLIDGDMKLIPGFLEAALSRMAADPGLAGVGGMMEEEGSLNAEFRIRQMMKANDRKPGQVSHLSGGGLYRTAAIGSVGYFSNRNLHAFEELELGLRLIDAGWSLERLPLISIRHYPHQKGSFELLRYRWKTNQVYASGDLIRSAFGKSYFLSVLLRFKFIFFVALWWSLVALALVLPLSAIRNTSLAGSLLLAPFILMSIRRKGVENGIYLICSWMLSFVGTCIGILRPQVDPASKVERNILRNGEWLTGGVLDNNHCATDMSSNYNGSRL